MASVNAVQQHLNFSSSGEEDSSDNSFDEWTLKSVPLLSPSAACQTPRVQRHRLSVTVSPSVPTSPIPYSAWKKLRLCDSPSTPKVGICWFRENRYGHSLHLPSFSFRVCCLKPPSLALPPSHAAVKDYCVCLLRLTACPR